MAEQSGKIRALRIRLDYHKSRGFLYWSRWACALLALLLSGGYGFFVLAGVFSTPVDSNQNPSTWLSRAALQVNTGPLAQVHAHLESDCQQCHSSGFFLPIAADALELNSKASLQTLTDKCQRCHAVQSHLATVSSSDCREMDQDCSSCHQDHRGRDVRLTSFANSRCTNCHANLNLVCEAENEWPTSPNIANFSTASHATRNGSFRSLAVDSGRIRFSHAQHLNPGQIKTGRRGGFEHAMLPPRWQTHYAADGQGLVQLACRDCHRLQTPSGNIGFEDIADLPSATDAELAHFYAPIDYEQHCTACHQMTFTGQTAEMLPLPHAAPRADIKQLLSAKLVGGKINGIVAMTKDQAIRDDPQTGRLTDAELSISVDGVFAGCAKCHMAEDVTDASIQKQLSLPAARPMIPQCWLQHGLFDHAAHERISNCGFCHEIPTSEASNDNTIVMIKGPESCIPCHRDASESGSSGSVAGTAVDLATDESRRKLLGAANQRNLASDDCALCHRYHWSRPRVKDAPASQANLRGPL